MELGDAVLEVLRLLTPLKMTYEAAKKRAEAYSKIVSVSRILPTPGSA